MNIANIRAFFMSVVTTAAGADVFVTAEGDISKPDQKQQRVRVKVFSLETVSIQGRSGIGLYRRKEEPGRVNIDVYGPMKDGIIGVETVANAIVNAITTSTYTVGGDQLIIWAVWAEAVLEETPYFRVTVFARWSLLHI